MKRIAERLSHYVYLFLGFCMVGWIYEVALGFLYGFGFVNRGFLFGPYLPVYGFGGVILVLMLQEIMKKKYSWGKIPMTPVLVFLLIMLITTAIEYATGVALEMLFHQRWWDYSTYFMNFQGLICFSATLRFGLGGMLYLYVLTPVFQLLIAKIPQRLRSGIAFVIVAILAADLYFTLRHLR